MELVFVTGNEGKYRSFRNIAEERGIKVERRELDYPEDHDSNSTRKIAMQGAEYCAEELGETVVVTDAGLFIETLDGFPGVNTGFTLDKIGNSGLIGLLENENNRKAVFRISVGFSDGETVKGFTAGTEGRIAEKERGDGFGFDPIFIPQGHGKTFGEDENLRDSVGPLVEAMEETIRWMEESY